MSKSFKYVNDFEFPREAGYSGSAGQTMVKGYARSGKSAIQTEGERLRNMTEGERLRFKERSEYIPTEGERLRNMTEGERLRATGMCKGGKYAEGGMSRAKGALRNERAEMARVKMETRSERKDAGDEMKRIRREERYDEAKVKQPARKQYPAARSEPLIPMAMNKGGMIPNRGKLGVVNNKNPGETVKHTAPNLPKMKMAKGGMTPKQQAKVGTVMGEFKAGKLHSGSKSGPEVTNPKQAVAIALSEARNVGKKKK